MLVLSSSAVALSLLSILSGVSAHDKHFRRLNRRLNPVVTYTNSSTPNGARLGQARTSSPQALSPESSIISTASVPPASSPAAKIPSSPVSSLAAPPSDIDSSVIVSSTPLPDLKAPGNKNPSSKLPSDVGRPLRNASSTITDAPSAPIRTPIISSNSTSGLSTGVVKAVNGSCGACVVNVRQAAYYSWYSQYINNYVGTISELSDGTYTIIPVTTVFDMNSQMQQPIWTDTMTWDPAQNSSAYTGWETVPALPAAASTSIVTITAAGDVAAGALISGDAYNSLNLPWSDAAITVAGAGGAPTAITSPSNFAVISEYEVVLPTQTVDGAGQVICATVTQTQTAANPYAFSFDGSVSVDGSTGSGDVPKEFLQQLPESSCSAGKLQAAPTLVVVVVISYEQMFTPFLVHPEQSVDDLDTPTQTAFHEPNLEGTDTPRPTGNPLGKARIEESTILTPTQAFAHFESTASSLDQPVKTPPTQITQPADNGVFMPFLVHQESSDITLFAPVTDGNVPAQTTIKIGDTPVVATAAPQAPAGQGPAIVPFVAHQEGTAVTLFGPAGNGPQTSVNIGGNIIVATAVPGAQPANPGSGSGGGAIGNAIAGVLGAGTNSPGSGSGGSAGAPAGAPAAAGNGGSGVVGGSNGSPGNIGNVIAAAIGAGGSPAGNAGSGNAGSGSGGSGSGSSGAIAQPAANAIPALTIGSAIITPNAATQFFLGPGQTLVPGGPPATLEGTVVSLAPSGTAVVINGQTTQLAAPAITAGPSINIGGTVFTPNQGFSFVVSGQTLVPGAAPITVDGHTISLGNDASVLVVDGQTMTEPPTVQTLAAPAITLANGQVFTAAAGGINGVPATFVIDGQTLLPGGTINVGGSSISLAPSGSTLLVNGVPTVLAPTLTTIPPNLVIGGQTIKPVLGAGNTWVIQGQTLTPGGVLTVDGSTISLSPGATAVVVNGKTTLLPGSSPRTTNPPILTVGTETFVANDGTTYTIHGQTLTPGGVLIFDGTTVSLSPGATQLVVNGKTTTLFPATTTKGLLAATGSVMTLTPETGPTVAPAAPAATGKNKKGVGSSLVSSSSCFAAAVSAAVSLFLCVWVY